MSRPRRGQFEAWLRGGQTVGHTFDMTVEVVGRLGLIAVLLALGFAMLVNNRANARQQTAGWLTAEAMILGQIGSPLPQQVTATSVDGSTHPVGVADVWKDPSIAEPARAYWGLARAGLIGWLGACWIIGIIAFWVFTYKGKDKMKARQIRGQEVARLSELKKEIEDFNVEEAQRRKRDFFFAPKLAGVPYPFDTELEHTLIVGAPGAGKSQAIHQLLESIREREQRAIIFDPELDFIRHHYDESVDTILNPFDARSPGWSPFFDATDTPDWVKLGHAIFKDPKSGDPYWVNVARSLFAWTGYRLMETNPNVGLDEALELLFGPPSRLKAFLEGTPAAMHLAGLEGGGARVASLISVLSEGVEPLIYLHGAKGRFSIKEWVNRPKVGNETDSGFLFLSAPESHMDALRPLLGFWSELAVSALLSRHDTTRTTTWFILDEFHSAGKIEKLADGPQRLRKYGGAVVLGFQQVSQLQDLYGPDKAKTIIGQCQTKLILRAGDFDTATLMSEQLGRRVMRRVEENTSYGANSIRDGVGLTPKEELEPVVLPEDVQNFPKFQGMIRVSNARATKPFPIAPIKLEYVPRKEVAPGFIPAAADPVRDYIAQRVRRASGQPPPADSQGPGGGSETPPPEQPKGGPRGEVGKASDVPLSQAPISSGQTRNLVGALGPATHRAPEAPESSGGKPDEKAPHTAQGLPQEAARSGQGSGSVGCSLPPVKVGRLVGAPAPADSGFQGNAAGAGIKAVQGTRAVASGAGAAEPPAVPVAGGGPEPEMQGSATSGSNEAEEADAQAQQKEMRPRRKDLPTDEAERLRRREEEDETYRNMRAADLRRDPDSDRVRVSVMQREGEMLREEQGAGEYLGSLETATQAEVIYAEQHRHEILETIVEVGVGGVVGANVDFREVVGGAETSEEPASEPEPSELKDKDRPMADELSDVAAEVRVGDLASDDPTTLEAPERTESPDVEVDTLVDDPRHRHRRHHHHRAESDVEYEVQPDAQTINRQDPDRDREPELEVTR